MTRFQSWLRSIPHKITGSAVDLKRYKAARIPALAFFPVDRNLVSRQLREGERLRAAGVQVKAVRK